VRALQPQADTPAPAGVAAPEAPALARNAEVEVVPPPRARTRSPPPQPEREVIGMPPARARSGEPRRRLQRSTPYPVPPPAPVPAPVPVRRGRAPLDPDRETLPRLRFWHPPPPPNDLNPQTYPRDPNTGRQRGCPKCYWSWWGCAQCTRPDYNPRTPRPDHVPDGGRAMGRGRKK
jgi:hypothetical protein